MTLFDSLAGILAPIAFLGTGFIIQIDNKDYLAAGNNQISLLGHGVETNVNVERIYSNKLPHPYTACKIQLDSSNGFSSDLYLMFLANKARYTQKDCFSLCKQQALIDKCHCTITQYITFNASIKICSTFDELKCEQRIKNDYINSAYLKNSCNPRCPIECYSTRYDGYQSFNNFNRNVYLDLVKEKTNFLSAFDNRTLSDEAIYAGLSKVNVFFNSLSYTQMEDTASLDGVALLGSIGGFAGLFLGMSLLSLVEVMSV